MTAAEWLAVKVGDFIVDRSTQHLAHREVLSVSRVSGRAEQRGKTRTMIRVPKIRGAGMTIICNSEDRSGARFILRVTRS